MAFSQVQCLDDSHVNWRSSESKPEFFYSEEQRLALEALASRGPDAFYEVLKRENIRDFLSELELKKILDTLETYDPGSEYIPRHGSSAGDSEGDRNSQGDEQDVAPSLEYWPQRSDRSIPHLDLGWPETIAYRGVTRATVYMQPPIEGQAHIKEVVRKMICQAQKVRCAAGTGQDRPQGVPLRVLPSRAIPVLREALPKQRQRGQACRFFLEINIWGRGFAEDAASLDQHSLGAAQPFPISVWQHHSSQGRCGPVGKTDGEKKGLSCSPAVSPWSQPLHNCYSRCDSM